jgi:Ca-activated chloride channel family protein
MPEFAAPLWLAALPLPPLLWLLLRIRRSGRDEALIHPLAPLIADLRPAPGRNLLTPALWLAGCLLLLLALARPQWSDPSSAATIPAYDLAIAVDLSGSMRALDYVDADGRPISRIDMVKAALARFLADSERVRVSLLVFADSAFTYMPATTDRDVASAMVAELDPSLAGERTALGDAIALAVHRSTQGAELPRALILLTDGSDTAGNIRPQAAAALAREHGMRIHALGFGREGVVPYPLGNGETIYRELPPDRALLATLAGTTGGSHHHIASPADMEQVLHRIHETESARADAAPVTRIELYPLAIVPGIICLLLAEISRRREVTP